MRKILNVKALPGYRLELSFDDGVAGIIDLSDLAGQGVFTLWLAPGAFERVRVGQAGELIWDDRIDLCPDALYLKVTGLKPEDIFPTLRRESAHA